MLCNLNYVKIYIISWYFEFSKIILFLIIQITKKYKNSLNQILKKAENHYYNICFWNNKNNSKVIWNKTKLITNRDNKITDK